MSENHLNPPKLDNVIDVVSYSPGSPLDYNIKIENVHYTQSGVCVFSQIHEENSSDESSDEEFTLKKKK